MLSVFIQLGHQRTDNGRGTDSMGLLLPHTTCNNNCAGIDDTTHITPEHINTDTCSETVATKLVAAVAKPEKS